MIYLIHGSDREKAKAKAKALMDSLMAKKPDASQGRFSADTFDLNMIDELVGGQGLFAARLIVLLEDLVSARTTVSGDIVKDLKRFAASDNIFIFLEGKLLKADLTAFEKHAEKIQEYGEPAGIKKIASAASPFALADALGKRDKKNLWRLYIEQLAQGSVAEELHGLLFWQIKSMLLAVNAADAAEAGLKPFVYGKAKQFSANFSADELQMLSGRFVSIYHDAHRGVAELSLLLEQTILEL